MAAASPQYLTVVHDGVERHYLRYVPDRVARAPGRVPLLLVLHGGGGRPRQIMRHSGFDRIADRAGFVVVYPAGLGRHWSDGRAATRGADDVGFLTKLIAVETRGRRVDPRRVFVAGISNGGFMSLRLACDAAGRFAGVAVVAAQFTRVLAPRCRPSRPIPILFMNGTADPLVPYRGGIVAARFGGRGTVVSTAATVRFWVRHNDCRTGPATALLPDRAPDDDTRIERQAWSGCAGGAVVRLYKVLGGGHGWPGKFQFLPRRLVGRTSYDADGSALIWAFFKNLPPSR